MVRYCSSKKYLAIYSAGAFNVGGGGEMAADPEKEIIL